MNFNLDKIHPSSYKFLHKLGNNNYKVSEDGKGNKKFEEQAPLLSTGLARETSPYAHGFAISQEGIKLYELGIKPIIQKE